MGIKDAVVGMVKDAVIEKGTEIAIEQGEKLVQKGAEKVASSEQQFASNDPKYNQSEAQTQQSKSEEKGMLESAVHGTAYLAAGAVQLASSVVGLIPGAGDVAEVVGEVGAGVIKAGSRAATGDMDGAKEEAAVAAARTGTAVLPISAGTFIAKEVAEEAVRTGFAMKNDGVEASKGDSSTSEISAPSPTPNVSKGQEQVAER